MKAIVWGGFGAPPALRDDVAEPAPGAGEVIVRVHASSVNAVDMAIVAGMLKDMVPHEFPVTLGRDFAGIVERVGDAVGAVSAGEEVFGFLPAMLPTVHDGAWAERIAVPEAGLTRTPDGVDTDAAGAAALAAVTAILCVDALELTRGDTVLIAGATGGVGSAAVQLAAASGATVIAPARRRTRSTCAGSEPPKSCRASATSPPPCASATRAASTPSSTSSTTRPALRGRAREWCSRLLVHQRGGRRSRPHERDGRAVTRDPRPHRAAPRRRHARGPDPADLRPRRAPEALQALGATHTQGKLVVRVD